jgi:hypothetical protein
VKQAHPGSDPCVAFWRSGAVVEAGEDDDEGDDVADGRKRRPEKLLKRFRSRGTLFKAGSGGQKCKEMCHGGVAQWTSHPPQKQTTRVRIPPGYSVKHKRICPNY